MSERKKYKFTIEDENTLEKRVNFSFTAPLFILFLVVFVVIAGAFGIFVFASTPMKNFLPGYLKESERTATEEQHIRLDSLVRIYEINEAYITGVLKALNPTQESLPIDTVGTLTPLTVDSLLPISDVEKEFMDRIQEREKYNINYTSTAAARSLRFGKVNKASVISETSKDNYTAEVLLPVNGTVSAIAEGKVISIASSPGAAGGYEIIIQHPQGFLSKSSGLTNLTVKAGDRVSAGEIIALGATNPGKKGNKMSLELWHDGDPLIPALYLDHNQN